MPLFNKKKSAEKLLQQQQQQQQQQQKQAAVRQAEYPRARGQPQHTGSPQRPSGQAARTGAAQTGPGRGGPASPQAHAHPHSGRRDEGIDDGTAALAASTAGRESKMAAAKGRQRMESDEDSALGDLGAGVGKMEMGETDAPINRSRLCKTLKEVLHDNGALPYFIQYMGSLNAKQLVQFWLAVESFSNASWSKARTDSMTTSENSSPTRSATIPEDQSEGRGTERVGNSHSANGNEHALSDGGDSARTIQNNNMKNLPSDGGGSQTGPIPGAGGVASPAAEPRIIVTKDTETNASPVREMNASPSGSPTKSGKTHTRAKSDSVVGFGKMMGGAFEPGHRRNNSWKEVDNKTAVERDAINIFTRYICKDATSPIGVPEDIRLRIIAKICPKDGHFDPDSFREAQSYAFNVMDKQYFQSFLRSEFHCKYQIDILTSGRVYLADILYNDTATFYFMEYLEQENAVHLLQFWLAGENFQQHLLSQQGTYDPTEAQNDAMVLYDKYFSLQATSPIGFDDTIRFKVECNICREGGPLPTCFSLPMRQAYTTLETMHFPGFLHSDLYYKFLSELINTIKSEQGAAATAVGAGSVATALEDDQLSTSSDPATTSTSGKGKKNTLLAEGNVVKLFQDDMNIDQVKFDPDSLWKRPKTGNMMFGKVNHLGQFVPAYEPDPECAQKRASSNKFSLKKLVTKEEDKNKEEMALKIAQMIINDVNMQTQGLAGTDIPSPTTAAPTKLQGL